MYRLIIFLLLCVSLVSVLAQVGKTTRVSLGGIWPPNGDTNRIAVSQTGRYIVYESLADNIVHNDTNGVSDIFLYDWIDKTTERISLTSTGLQANGASFRPDVSASGRFVVFQSAATNLVAGDTNGSSDIFVRDREAQTTFRVSVSTGGVQGNAVSSIAEISDDGGKVAFTSSATNLVAGDTNGVADAFVRNLSAGTTTHVSTNSLGTFPNSSVSDVAISGNGNVVAFSTSATNLFGGTNGVTQVYLRNLPAATTHLISRHTSGAIGNATSRLPSIDFSGNIVAFRSGATNLVASDTNGVDDVFVRNIASSTTQRASLSISGIQGNAASLGAAVSSSGTAVAFQSTATNLVTGDTNGVSDVFRRDLVSNQTIRASVTSFGSQTNGASTSAALGDADLVVFLSSATNIVGGDLNNADDGFLRFLQGGEPYSARVTNTSSHSNANSQASDMDASGRGIVFRSFASNLVPDPLGFWDIFKFNRDSLYMQVASRSNEWELGNDSSNNPAVSADGRRIAFESYASNLVVGDTNNRLDVFVRFDDSSTIRVSESSAGAQANHHSQTPVISANGRYVAFASEATNLVSGDTNGFADVFLHDIDTGLTTRLSTSSSGQQCNDHAFPTAISADGNFVVFNSRATNLVAGDTNGVTDVFLRNVSAGTTERVSVSSAGAQGNELSRDGDISADGSLIVFESDATNLVAGDTNNSRDVFVRNRVANTTVRVSLSSAGAQATGGSGQPAISADGQSVAFQSNATNLVPNDTNGVQDIFVKSLAFGTTRRVSLSTAGQEANGYSEDPSMSRDGLVVSFTSTATNFDPSDTTDGTDIYINDSRIPVDLVTVVRGVVESLVARLFALTYPDDIHFVLRPGITFSTAQAPVEFIVETTALVLNPSRLEFAIEYSTTASSIRQTIEMFNFDTQLYELVDARQSTLTDAVVVIPITSNAGRFVSPTGQMRSRLGYKAAGPVFAYPWRTKIDHIRWTAF